MNNSTKLSIFTALFALTLIFSSCSQTLLNYGVMSSANHSIQFDKSKGVRVVGKSYGIYGIGASITDAMFEALETAGPQYDLLIDGVVRVENYPIIIVYVVEGTAISSSNLKAKLGNKGFEDWCKSNKILDQTKDKTTN